MRFFVNFGLSVLCVGSVLALFIDLRLSESIGSSRFFTGVFLVTACLLLILFAHLRTAVQAWMNRAVFRRQSTEECVKQIRAVCAKARSEQELLSGAAQQIAEYLRTDCFAVAAQKPDPAPSSNWPPREDTERPFRPEIQMPLRLSSGDRPYLLLGSRRGGQRYWSDDLNDLRLLGAAVVEQVERFRSQELNRLVTQAELRALQAQINPHFLFNALNTLYGTIDRGSQDARRIVLNLAELFRYTLQGSRSLIPLSEEFRIIEAYLEIERLRLGDRFTSEVVIHDSVRQCLIPVLSVQPLVENAVKHGASQKSGSVSVTVLGEVADHGVRVTVQDTGGGFGRSPARSHSGTGVGLENVRRRLTLSYGPSANLDIRSSEAGTSVSFLVPLSTDEKLPSENEAIHA